MGGVLVSLDLERCLRNFEKIGFSDVRRYVNKYHQLGIFGSLEGGQLDEEDFYRELAQHCRSGVTKAEMRAAYVSILNEIDPDLPEFLFRLKKDYRLYVLSNNNPMCAEVFHHQLSRAGHPVEELFDRLFYSYQLKLQKPFPEIFRYVLEHIDAEPGEILFIDDSIQNLETARQFGIKTARMSPEDNLEELTESFLTSARSEVL